MTDMNAAETIQAAIDKLTRLRDEANVAPWSLYFRSGKNAAHGGIDSPSGYVSSPSLKAGNADLIITLHATIDAQLAILQDSIDYRDTLARAGVEWVEKDNSAVLLLARAILGEQVDA